MSIDGADIEAAMRAVVEDMGQAARKFKAKRYEKRPTTAPASDAAKEPESAEADMPNASELESMLCEE